MPKVTKKALIGYIAKLEARIDQLERWSEAHCDDERRYREAADSAIAQTLVDVASQTKERAPHPANVLASKVKR